MSKLEEVIKYFGSQSELARRLNITRSAVNQWFNEGIPPAQAIEIERETGGLFKAVDLT